jgi:membrane dipeptidase
LSTKRHVAEVGLQESFMTRRIFVAALILAGAAVQAAPAGAQTADAALIQKARGIHDRVIALDTHDDIEPANFTRQKNYTQRLDTQVNIPKMKEGGPMRRSSSSTSARAR